MERTHRPWFVKHEKLYAQATRDLIAKGTAIDDNELELDKGGRISLRAILERDIEEAGADFWLSPAALGPAPVGLDATGSPLASLPWTNAGVPTLALPTCQTVDCMPVGIQLAAPFWADEKLLALGAVVEACLGAPH